MTGKREIVDPEVSILAGIAGTLRADYVKEGANDPWAGSPFAWIKTRPSRQVGKIGEQLVAGWCAAKGFDVTHTGDSEADRVIGGRRMEIKFSTLWEAGTYTFQQIRDQNYEFALCLGVSPFDAHLWVVPKDIIREHSPPQHGGRSGTDTRWLTFRADDAPRWIGDYGGRLSKAFDVLKQAARTGRFRA